MTSTDVSELEKKIEELVRTEKIRTFIGWEQGSNSFRSRPAFIRTQDEAKDVIFSPACSPCLVRMIIEDLHYPLDDAKDKKPLGIALRGCDDKGIIELVKDRRIRREDIVIIGVDCRGVVDWKKARELLRSGELTLEEIIHGKLDWFEGDIVIEMPSGKKIVEKESILMSKCLECEGHTPRIYDHLIGQEDKRRIPSPNPPEILELEKKTSDEKWEFWEDVFSRCIRCYACRNICTYCYCEECAIDPTNIAVAADTIASDKANRPEWVGRDSSETSNAIYLFMRAFHGTGRCISCEECDRACPMSLPLRLLNRKVRKDTKELFDYEAGKKIDDKPLLGNTCDNDPGEFIW